MTTRLAWLAPRAASCFYAVAALAERRTLVDAALGARLAPLLEPLLAQLDDAGVAPADFFAHLVPLSSSVSAARELASLALTRCVGRQRAAELSATGSASASIADLLAALCRAYDAARPTLEDELALRAGPLAEQWEARGAGLLAGVRRLSEADLLPEQAQIVLVEPVLGGGGVAFAPYNALVFEAVLANPVPQLHEVVRLAWLVSQLNLDLPRYADRLMRSRLTRAAQLALTPLVLAAAEEVELARLDRATIALALATWGAEQGEVAGVADTVSEWWQVYSESRPEFPAALVALDRMLGGSA